jgi:hypothetical protein
MLNVADCRHIANQCLALACKRGVSENRRKALFEMATTWGRLAAELTEGRWRARHFLGVDESAARARSIVGERPLHLRRQP